MLRLSTRILYKHISQCRDTAGGFYGGTSTLGNYSSVAEVSGFLEDQHSDWRSCIVNGDFKIRNTTKHHCEIWYSSSITCYWVYTYYLPKQIKWQSFTFPDFYSYALADVLPEDTLACMSYYIHHKYKWAHYYLCIDEFSNISVAWMTYYTLHGYNGAHNYACVSVSSGLNA
jgi:hypothetical protein